jgi:hypothetical protein
MHTTTKKNNVFTLKFFSMIFFEMLLEIYMYVPIELILNNKFPVFEYLQDVSNMYWFDMIHCLLEKFSSDNQCYSFFQSIIVIT